MFHNTICLLTGLPGCRNVVPISHSPREQRERTVMSIWIAIIVGTMIGWPIGKHLYS